MTAREDFDRLLASWLAADAAAREPEYLLGSVLARTARTRRRPAWLIPERWISMSAITSRVAAAPRVPWRLVLALALLVLALVAVALLGFGGQQRELPSPFGPAANGLVAYSADGDIYTVDPATGVSRAVITGPETDLDPVWSLDGTRFAFQRRMTGEAGGRLYVARADGSDLTAITPEPLTRIDRVSFSPDGRNVLFGSGFPWTISIARADGSGVRTLDLPIAATEPEYRPADGAEIAFTGSPTSSELVTGIYLVNADGSGLRNLVPPAREAAAFGPRWSPDGSLIAYQLVDLTVQHWTVQTHVMSADGGGDRTLPAPSDATWSHVATWSNDGTRLAMLRGYTVTGYQDVSIAIVPADGSGIGIETGRRDLGSDPVGLEWAPDDTAVLMTPLSSSGPDPEPARQLLVDVGTGEVSSATWATLSRPAWQRVAP